MSTLLFYDFESAGIIQRWVRKSSLYHYNGKHPSLGSIGLRDILNRNEDANIGRPDCKRGYRGYVTEMLSFGSIVVANLHH
jgi:hypothetical protein